MVGHKGALLKMAEIRFRKVKRRGSPELKENGQWVPVPQLEGDSQEQFIGHLDPQRKPLVLKGIDLGARTSKWTEDFPGGPDSKVSAYNVGDPGSITGSGRPSREGNGNPLQYSCLENTMDGGAWGAGVHGATKSQTQLSDFTCTSRWTVDHLSQIRRKEVKIHVAAVAPRTSLNF